MDGLKRLAEHCPQIQILELYGFDLKRILDALGDDVSEELTQRFPALESLMVIEQSQLPPNTLSRLPQSLRSIHFYQNKGVPMPVHTLPTLQHTDVFKELLDWQNIQAIGNIMTQEVIGALLLINSERLRASLPHLQEINGRPLEALQPLDTPTLLGEALPVLERLFGTTLGSHSFSELVNFLRIHMDDERIEDIFGIPLEHFPNA
jgi:hypothetical protein